MPTCLHESFGAADAGLSVLRRCRQGGAGSGLRRVDARQRAGDGRGCRNVAPRNSCRRRPVSPSTRGLAAVQARCSASEEATRSRAAAALQHRRRRGGHGGASRPAVGPREMSGAGEDLGGARTPSAGRVPFMSTAASRARASQEPGWRRTSVPASAAPSFACPDTASSAARSMMPAGSRPVAGLQACRRFSRLVAGKRDAIPHRIPPGQRRRDGSALPMAAVAPSRSPAEILRAAIVK